ncbi:hypothetical protein C8Q77DRAFT_1161262 [Trametes polyzona]|nr:hypothetical protein C8Q77DRAFT_1161262 [Trametes polyzona]
MILPDDTPESPTKSRAGPLSPTVDEEFVPPPPAYPGHGPSQQASAASQQLDATARTSTPVTTPLLEQPRHDVERVEHAPTRFFKALGLALLIWITVGSFARTLYSSVHINHPVVVPGGRKGAPSSPGRGDGGSRDDYPGGIIVPTPEDGTVERCVRGSSLYQVRGSKGASFRLPLSADVLYIFGRGVLSQGSITISSTEDRSIPQDQVQVDIVVVYHSVRSLDLVNFCLLERSPGQKGLGILTPSYKTLQNDLHFVIDVRFPASRHGDVLRVKAFETELTNFKHIVKSLEGKVRFDSISLTSRHTSIHSDYLSANEAALVTRDARITGTYHATRSLHLETSNANVEADVTLYHDDSKQSYTNLTMLNWNAAIDTRLTLRSTSSLSTGGLFDAVAHTSNSHMTVIVPSQPPESTLLLSAKTSNSAASVQLPPAFEGAWLAETTAGYVELGCDVTAHDPSGQERTRRCAFPSVAPNRVEGWTSWGERGERHGLGDVTVKSTNAAVKLMV